MIIRLIFLEKLLEAIGAWKTLGVLAIGLLLSVLLTAVLLRASHAMFNLLMRNHEAQLAAWSWGESIAAGFAVLVVAHGASIVAGYLLRMDLMTVTEYDWRFHQLPTDFFKLLPILTFPFGLFAIAVTLRQLLRTTFSKGLAVATIYATLTLSLVLAILGVVELITAK